VDAALPNFHETFGTTTLQPYAEYEWQVAPTVRITPGLKLAYYKQDFVQFADNGKTVGSLGGAASISHAVDYSSWLPSIDAHYLPRPYWSLYGQYGKGQTIPPTSVFDVKNAAVGTLPKPQLTDTYQVGSVWKSNRATLDVDAYYIRFQNAYSATLDPASGETVYFLTADSVTKGAEVESTILVGGGLAVYVNGTAGTARYTDTNQWVQNAPRDTETLGLTFNKGSWNLGLFNKRIGQQWNDNGAAHEAVFIDPLNIANVFLNYTLGGSSKLQRSRIRLAINNLTDSHAITAVTPASTTSNAPSPNDILTLMAGRSVSIQFTVGVSGK
jgi:iron complex outermembrane receptor protein